MIRFTRRVTLRNAANVPRAISFATELNGYLNKKYNLELHFGMQMFGESAMCWYLDVPDVSRLEQLNVKLLGDKDYIKMLDGVKDLWVDGTLHDSVVSIVQ